MLKRLIWVAIATFFFAAQVFVGSAAALELDESIRTVPANEDGDLIVLNTQETERGKRLFNDICAQCHVGGVTKTNPNVNLALDALANAEPPRDNIAGLVDYMQHPTSYDGELDMSELHPNTERSDLWPEMRNLTEDDLVAIAGHILIQPKVRGIVWGGGKAYN